MSTYHGLENSGLVDGRSGQVTRRRRLNSNDAGLVGLNVGVSSRARLNGAVVRGSRVLRGEW